MDVGGATSCIQLLAPLNENSTIAKFLAKSGPGIQQMAYRVDVYKRQAIGADLGEPGQPELLGLALAHDHDRGGTVADLARGAGGDGAVLGERRPKRGQRLLSGVGAHALVAVDDLRLTLAPVSYTHLDVYKRQVLT